ncbi:MAG: DUF4365 domain-containing protein [Gammaproteobacteria bacterium]|nr:DUF4365 domain-containing protein [Gammaproteobacteria bacterium]
MITKQVQQEELSYVYVHALATRAGYTTVRPQIDFDSVDMKISSDSNQGMRPQLDIQLKATTRLGKPREQGIPFRIKQKNYNDLCINTQVPRLLVVLDMPEEDKWMTVTDQKLILRRRAYWLSLQNKKHKQTEQKTTTVYIPVKTF